jgi:hypothetical protein
MRVSRWAFPEGDVARPPERGVQDDGDRGILGAVFLALRLEGDRIEHGAALAGAPCALALLSFHQRAAGCMHGGGSRGRSGDDVRMPWVFGVGIASVLWGNSGEPKLTLGCSEHFGAGGFFSWD